MYGCFYETERQEESHMTALPSLTILIVDDNTEDRAVCSRFLSRHPAVAYTCIEAVTGTEGLTLYHSARPDCLILNLNLPDMDGVQFLAAMPAALHSQSCPVVLLTGQESEPIAVQALHCGAQDYLVKGDISADLLHRTIINAIDKFRLRQLLEEQRCALYQQNLILRQREECLSALNATLEQQIVERTALLALLQEITNAANERERAAEELQHKQEALRQREKLAAMRSLLANVAHELNNPLAMILLQADLLREEAPGEGVAEHAQEITQAATRCERLVHNFLTLSHPHPTERIAVDLNVLIAHTLELLEPVFRGDNVAVELCLDADLPSIQADVDQIRQVLVHLITNAHQALCEVKAPRRMTLTTRCDATRTQIALEVVDIGPGIPPALRTRIFEPFFTTKPPGMGTGLGLSLCQGILEGHGGTIRVTSQPGQGAAFRVELPVGERPVTAAPAPEEEIYQPVHGQTILIVDDEPSVIRGLTRLLRRDGHTVDTAPNGRLALDRLQERTYDVILSDLRMPELDGAGLYQALEQYPELRQRFVFLTGDTLSHETMAFFEQTGVRWLTKPFRAAEVRRTIQQTLPRQVRAGFAPSPPEREPGNMTMQSGA